ncbi:hypothetical protein C21880S2P_00032 [Bacteroides phage C2_18_80S2P]|nr:hypothetical protein C21880S2P_00032 [Bacteroides phage C2_18_80S2P]
MACIGKITASLAMPCGAPGPNEMGQPVSAKLLNASDIASFTVLTTGATVTRVAKAVGYDVTTVNNAFTISVGLKSQDIMPGAYDVSITFKNFSVTQNTVGYTPLSTVDELGRAELVVAVEYSSGIVRIYGLGAPLVCTEIVGDSTAGDFYTYTFGVEDWQVGTTIHQLSKADYDALSTPAPAPGA